jgi:hypothetical protein
MSRFLDTSGEQVLTVGICDRCQRKFPLKHLRPDPNAPGLMVCRDDIDVFDPWRLPAPAAEQIAVPNTRPDQSVAGTGTFTINPNGGDLVSAPYPTNLAVVPSST